MLKLHYYFRCPSLPIDMLNNDNWELICHTRSLDCTLYLDILLCCEVLSLASNLSSSCSLISVCNSFLILISQTYRTKQLGPILKLVTCVLVLPLLLILWPVVGIVGSIVGGAAYGFLSPIFATFKAVEEGKEDKFFHCFTVCLFLKLLKCLPLFLHYCCYSLQKFHTASTGWYVEHCFKDL